MRDCIRERSRLLAILAVAACAVDGGLREVRSCAIYRLFSAGSCFGVVRQRLRRVRRVLAAKRSGQSGIASARPCPPSRSLRSGLAPGAAALLISYCLWLS
jgi:hypothetical protein